MSRGVLVRLLLVLGLLAGCAALALNREPRLGLDLRGGTQITLQTSSTDRVEANAESTDRAIEVLRGRVDALGISEPTLTRAGSDRIIVELPDVQDPREAVETLGRTAQLTMHGVVGTAASADAEPTEEGNVILPDEGGGFLELTPAKLEGEDITGADAVQNPQRVDWVVTVDFDSAGLRRLRRAVRRPPRAPRATRAGSRSCSTTRSSPAPRCRCPAAAGSPTPPRSPATSTTPTPPSWPS